MFSSGLDLCQVHTDVLSQAGACSGPLRGSCIGPLSASCSGPISGACNGPLSASCRQWGSHQGIMFLQKALARWEVHAVGLCEVHAVGLCEVHAMGLSPVMQCVLTGIIGLISYT